MFKALCIGVVYAGVAGVGEDQGKKPTDEGSIVKSLYEFTVSDIEGKEVSLAKYKGDVCLIVNVASL